jgi:probable phosphoglycerate mutase
MKLRRNEVQPDAVYSSDLGRAFITAYTIARTQGLDEDTRRLPGLREQNYGDAAYLPIDESIDIYTELHRDTHFVPPNGESLHQMQQRVLGTVADLSTAHQGETVLLAAHDGVIKALYASFAGKDIGEHNIYHEYAHDFVAKFTLDDGMVVSFEEVV